MLHKHHIIPRHMGGSDDPSNLIELTPEEHAQAHLDLYETHGKKEDLCAYYMISGFKEEAFKIAITLGGKAVQRNRKEKGLTCYGLTSEENKDVARKGGLTQGKRNAETGHMLRIREMNDSRESGRKGGKRTVELGKGSFGDPTIRLESARKGGLTQGKRNAETDHLKTIAQDYWNRVKSGEVSRTKKKWYHNNELQVSMLIKENESVPPGYKEGRKIKW